MSGFRGPRKRPRDDSRTRCGGRTNLTSSRTRSASPTAASTSCSGRSVSTTRPAKRLPGFGYFPLLIRCTASLACFEGGRPAQPCSKARDTPVSLHAPHDWQISSAVGLATCGLAMSPTRMWWPRGSATSCARYALLPGQGAAPGTDLALNAPHSVQYCRLRI